MNKKTFVTATVLVAVVMTALFFVRIGLDEVYHTTWLLRTIDTVAGWILSVLSILILPIMLLAGKNLNINAAGLILFLVVSSLFWGIIAERILHLLKRKTTT